MARQDGAERKEDMKKYIIEWDAGYGKNYDCIEAESLEDAQMAAYQSWKDEVDSNAEYGAKELTRDVAEDYGFEDELEGDE